MAIRAVLLLSLVLVTTPKVWSADANDLVRVLQSGRCANCRLADADLVHADLRDADLNERNCSAPISARPVWTEPI